MPFHQFNSFTGRLKESSRLDPFYPISPAPLDKAEQIMIYDSVKITPVKAGAATQAAGYSTLPTKFAEAFKRFQVDIHSPIFVMGGPKDKALYMATAIAVGCLSGFGIFNVARRI